MKEQKCSRGHAMIGFAVVGIRESRRRWTIVAAVVFFSFVLSQLYRQPFALAIPLGHEAHAVIDRLLAPPSITVEPGFNATLTGGARRTLRSALYGPAKRHGLDE